MDKIDREEIKNLRIADAIAKQHLRAAARAKDDRMHFSKIKSSLLRDIIISALKRPGVAPNTRLRSKSGATSFHFRLTGVRNTSIELSRIAGKSTKGIAEAHARYIEREGAAEKLRDTQDHEPSSQMQSYIEREGAAEEVGEELASFGNISSNYYDRLKFWSLVEASERKPQKHKLKFFTDQYPSFWEKVRNDPNAPEVFKSAYIGDLKEIIANEETITNLIQYAKKQGGFKGRRKAVSYEPGRGGRVQSRMILELPHDISPAARLDLAKEFCQVFEDKKLPYWTVIHAPDHHNDARNNHMHIVFYERPANLMPHPETGEIVWDFTISITKRDNNKHVRTTRPFRQAKDRDLNNKKWIPQQRKRFADLSNDYLKRAGVSRSIDPRSYKQMGINAEPIKRLSPTEYAHEKKGIDTPTGEKVIKAQWDREQKILSNRYDDFVLNKSVKHRFSKALKASKNSTLGDRLFNAYKCWSEAEKWAHALDAYAAAGEFVLKKIESKTLPPLRSNSPYEQDALIFSELWRENEIQPYATARDKSKARGAYAERFLKYAERKIEENDLDDVHYRKFIQGMANQASDLIQNYPNILNVLDKVEDINKSYQDYIFLQPPHKGKKAPKVANAAKKQPSKIKPEPETINTAAKAPEIKPVQQTSVSAVQTDTSKKASSKPAAVKKPAEIQIPKVAPVIDYTARERQGMERLKALDREIELRKRLEEKREEARRISAYPPGMAPDKPADSSADKKLANAQDNTTSPTVAPVQTTPVLIKKAEIARNDPIKPDQRNDQTTTPVNSSIQPRSPVPAPLNHPEERVSPNVVAPIPDAVKSTPAELQKEKPVSPAPSPSTPDANEMLRRALFAQRKRKKKSKDDGRGM